MLPIDFESCKRFNCPHYDPPMRAFDQDMEQSCNLVLEWNAQHIYTNNDGDTIEDGSRMLPWKDLPPECPFVLEQTIIRDPEKA